MTIQQCKYILTIAQYGSFNKAAKQLFVAQSSLSVSVKALEQELNIRIFERSGTGVYLTPDGAEFARYARQLVEQESFIQKRYTTPCDPKRLFVSTQHYDFVADIFGKLLSQITEAPYQLSLRELKTYDVIQETENAFCDVGIIALKSSDRSIMERYIAQRGLTFTPVLKALPHVYVRREHPLAQQTQISSDMLKDYPYVSYEQGEHDVSFFAEEIAPVSSDRQIQISDRASLMNLLLAADCFTVGTGIMPSMLNQGRIISIPFACSDHYAIGYLLRSDRSLSPLTKDFLDMLCKTAEQFDDLQA